MCRGTIPRRLDPLPFAAIRTPPHRLLGGESDRVRLPIPQRIAIVPVLDGERRSRGERQTDLVPQNGAELGGIARRTIRKDFVRPRLFKMLLEQVTNEIQVRVPRARQGAARDDGLIVRNPHLLILRRDIDLLKGDDVDAGHLDMVRQRKRALLARGARSASQMLDIPACDLQKAHGPLPGRALVRQDAEHNLPWKSYSAVQGGTTSS
jgi:hypothetical protein